jgi:hypothetical protein
MPKDVDRDIEKINFADIETIERRLERYVDEMVERRLKSHVLDEIVDSAVSECRDQISAECKTNEAEFCEQVDDGNSEVRNTANECMNEIKEQARMFMHEMEDQAQPKQTLSPPRQGTRQGELIHIDCCHTQSPWAQTDPPNSHNSSGIQQTPEKWGVQRSLQSLTPGSVGRPEASIGC